MLCGRGKQTLMHVLNFCPEALKRYKWRHDNVVVSLQSFLNAHVSVNCPAKRVLCDVVTAENCIQTDQKRETIPSDILCTSQRPDITIIDDSEKEFWVIEITVPFESNIEAAQLRKAERYAPLLAGLEGVGYKCHYSSIEVGCRGVIAHGTFKCLKAITGASRKSIRTFMSQLSKTVIRCSYCIFRARDSHELFSNVILQ